MATSKTLTPTNVTIQIPEFTDQPDQRVNSNCIDKEADAINSLNTAIGALTVSSDANTVSTGKTERFQFDASTLNTPYKEGITSFASGWIESFASSSNYATQIGHVSGDGDFTRTKKSGTWNSWQRLALKSDLNSWTLYNTNGNTYPTSSAFLVVVTKSGGVYESKLIHTNPSGCNIYFPTVASNCYVYFNGTGGFSATNLPSGYSVSIYTH